MKIHHTKSFIGIIPAGMIPFFLSLLLFSCMEDNFRDVRIPDSTSWRPYLALPVGSGQVDVNDFFLDYLPTDTLPYDTTSVYYNDSLYHLDRERVVTEHRFDYSPADYIDSSDYIEYARVFFRVENHYPTQTRFQLYLLDHQGAVVDSVFEGPQQIKPGITDDSGRVNKPSRQVFDSELERGQIDSLFTFPHLLLRSHVMLENEQFPTVRFDPAEGIWVEVYLRVRLEIRKDDLWEGI